MTDKTTTIDDLRRSMEAFVSERDWQQFHTPKNLAIALAVEAAEVMEHFQWLDPQESRAVAHDAGRRAAVGEELADCLCYLLAMASELNIDLSDAVRGKMLKNAQKYPADQYRGRWGAGDRRPAGGV